MNSLDLIEDMLKRKMGTLSFFSDHFHFTSPEGSWKSRELIGLLKTIDPDDRIHKVQEEVCQWFNISIYEMKSHRRPNHIHLPRQIAVHFCRELLNIPLTELAHCFNRSPAAIKLMISALENRVSVEEKLAQQIEMIGNKLSLSIIDNHYNESFNSKVPRNMGSS